MTNEERLEDIKEFVGPLLDREGKVIGFDLTKVELDFLFKQVEHTQHLERKYENTGSMFGRQAQRTLLDENKRLRESLDFYANYDNYFEQSWADTHIESEVQRDRGSRATEALEDNQ